MRFAGIPSPWREREDVMPIYDYECEACGPFREMQPMARFRDACACPRCGTDAQRILSSAPAIGSINAAVDPSDKARGPMETGPRLSSAAHPAGCGCCTRRMPLPGALAEGGRVFASHGPVRRGE